MQICFYSNSTPKFWRFLIWFSLDIFYVVLANMFLSSRSIFEESFSMFFDLCSHISVHATLRSCGTIEIIRLVFLCARPIDISCKGRLANVLRKRFNSDRYIMNN